MTQYLILFNCHPNHHLYVYKMDPYVAFTGIFFDVVFGQYLIQEMGKKLPSTMWNESVIASFSGKYHPWCHDHFVKNEGLECEIKVPIGYHSMFYQHNM